MGEFVDRSKSTLPCRADCSSPDGPRATSSTTAGVGSEVEDHVGSRHHLGRRVSPYRAGREVRLGGGPPHVMDNQVVARGLQIGRHVLAHGAEPDETGLHAVFSARTRAAARPALIAAGHPA